MRSALLWIAVGVVSFVVYTVGHGPEFDGM